MFRVRQPASISSTQFSRFAVQSVRDYVTGIIIRSLNSLLPIRASIRMQHMFRQFLSYVHFHSKHVCRVGLWSATTVWECVHTECACSTQIRWFTSWRWICSCQKTRQLNALTLGGYNFFSPAAYSLVISVSIDAKSNIYLIFIRSNWNASRDWFNEFPKSGNFNWNAFATELITHLANTTAMRQQQQKRRPNICENWSNVYFKIFNYNRL